MRFRLRLAALVFAALVVLALGACGTVLQPPVTPAVPHKTTFAQKAQLEMARACPPGQAFMGCSTGAPAPSHRLAARPTGPLFPDVSSWQGAVNWPAVKAWQVSHGWSPAEIFKMGEFHADPFAPRNSAVPASLGFWRAGYWFVRATGCQHELAQIIAAGHAYGLRVVVLDLEVPEARGYGVCLSPGLRAAGFIVVEYTAPGTNPGGADPSDPLWIATYGSGFSCIWTCHPVAWQFTDGQFGAVVFIPGIGTDDVNVDLGITKLGGAPPPPPDPYAIFLKRTVLIDGMRLSEYDSARHFDKWHCRGNPRPVRALCRIGRAHLVLLRDRVIYVAHHPLVHGHATYGIADRGQRVHGFQIRVWRSHG